MKRFLCTSALSLLFVLGNACAETQKPTEDPAHEEHEGHGAHEHGAAKLSIAVGAEGLEIALDSPAANVVGFEHIPATDNDKKKMKDTVDKLEAGDDLFELDAAAECELKDTEVLSALHGDDMEKPILPEAGEHNDIAVTWSYACAKPAAVKTVGVKLFSAFPEGFQHINVEWLTDKGASAAVLDKDGSVQLN